MSTTVILGLGSSQGNRLYHLRQAINKLNAVDAITVCNIAPVYISDALLPDDAEEDWHTYYLNSALHCETDLSAQALLATVKAIEQDIGRKPAKRWAPRIIDIDILCFGGDVIQQANLHVPHHEIINRPFVLWPLLDLQPNWQLPGLSAALQTWGDRLSGNAPFHTRQITQQLVGPELVGIINLTPDSFASDGVLNYSLALTQAKQLFADGATILDIGAESTNPNSTAITSEQECQRLLPFLDILQSEWQPGEFQPLISIDTYHAATVENVLTYNVDIINDVSTKELPAIAALLKGTNKKYVFMHSIDVPAVKGKTLPAHCDPVQEILRWGQTTINKLLHLGLTSQQLIYDIGIGFGNSPAQALVMLQHVNAFSQLDVPVYIGHSRKSFMNQFTQNDFSERDIETALITSYLAKQNVDYLRVHNVAINNQAIKIAYALQALTGTKREAISDTLAV